MDSSSSSNTSSAFWVWWLALWAVAVFAALYGALLIGHLLRRSWGRHTITVTRERIRYTQEVPRSHIIVPFNLVRKEKRNMSIVEALERSHPSPMVPFILPEPPLDFHGQGPALEVTDTSDFSFDPPMRPPPHAQDVSTKSGVFQTPSDGHVKTPALPLSYIQPNHQSPLPPPRSDTAVEDCPAEGCGQFMKSSDIKAHMYQEHHKVACALFGPEPSAPASPPPPTLPNPFSSSPALEGRENGPSEVSES
eukprot:gene9638-1733_t